MNSLKSKLAIDRGERAKTTPNIPMDIAHQLNCKKLITCTGNETAGRPFRQQVVSTFEIIREINNPGLKLLFDIYHMQIMEGNLIASIVQNIFLIGHFHATFRIRVLAI